MKVGDLVKNIYTEELGIVSGLAIDSPSEYVDVIFLEGHFLVPVEHLEVVS